MKTKFENNTTGEIIEASTIERENGKIYAVIELDEFLKHFSLSIDWDKDLFSKPIKPNNPRIYVDYSLNEDDLINFTGKDF